MEFTDRELELIVAGLECLADDEQEMDAKEVTFTELYTLVERFHSFQ